MARRPVIPFAFAIGTLAGGLAFANVAGCSLGEGTGSATGWLNAPTCWTGPIDLRPDFFAAVPSLPSLLIRVQNGGDYESFSDGIAFTVDDVGEVRGDPTSEGTPRPSLLGDTLVVGLPASVTAPGAPIVPTADPTIVHATLYLENTCRTQNLALYATTVSLDPNDTDRTCLPLEGGQTPYSCGGPAIAAMAADGGVAVPGPASDGSAATPISPADGGGKTSAPDGGPDGQATAASEAGAGAPFIAGTSTMVFHNLFDGNEAEANASQRLSWADFDLYFADPREACPGGFGPPPPCRGHVSGSFKFYFERGRPAQPFP
jgi:hypothetical protein